MKSSLTRIAALLTCGAPLLLAQGGMTPYVQDFYNNSSKTNSNWTINGSASYGSGELQIPSASGASLISKVAVPDGTTQYQVATEGSYMGGGAFTLYLEATSNALFNPTGASTGSFYVFVTRKRDRPTHAPAHKQLCTKR